MLIAQAQQSFEQPGNAYISSSDQNVIAAWAPCCHMSRQTLCQAGLPDDTINVKFLGTAGQSLVRSSRMALHLIVWRR